MHSSSFVTSFGVSLLLLLLVSTGCQTDGSSSTSPEETTSLEPYAGDLPLDRLQLPTGYAIDVFAEALDNARSLAYAGEGLVFVGTRDEGSVYAVLDTNGDMRADLKYVLDTDLQMPNGVAYRNGDLYVATVSQILRYRDIRSHLDAPGEPEVIYDRYPTETHHGWKYIAFGPDDKLYVPVGAPCNICLSDDSIFATITRLDVDAARPAPEIVAHGVRNTVGFNWHPTTGDLYFTDNGRDQLGDDVPPCEFNHLTAVGQHFGYPYCHGGTIADPEFGSKRPCNDFVPPTQNLAAHVAPLGLEFVTSPSFSEWTGQVLMAEHGSWNRTVPQGYRITRVPLQAGKGTGYEVFIDGWLDEASGEAWGRPVDLEWLPDGSLLISDDMAGVIYRVYKA